MGRLIKRAAWCLAALALLLGAPIVLTARSGDPTKYPAKPTDQRTEIFLVSHGYHSGIVVPRAALATVAGERGRGALIGIATRFYAYPRIEFAWGEEELYRSDASAGSRTAGHAVRALGRPGHASVMQGVGRP